MLNYNLILDVDSYKNQHGRMLKDGVEFIQSSIIPRKNKADIFTPYVVPFGYVYAVKEYLSKPITKENIDEAEMYFKMHGDSFDRSRWEYIINEHQGKLPLIIHAVKEGQHIPVGMPLVRVENTDPNCAWLVSYIETMLLRAVWYGTTVATNAHAIKLYLKDFANKTWRDDAFIDFHLHNFGARGGSSLESEVISSMAHSISFAGSDSMQANRAINTYYRKDNEAVKPYVFSVMASEHSVSCSNSDYETRNDFAIAVKMLDLLEEEIAKKEKEGKSFAVTGEQTIVSVVADTYDVYRFTDKYMGQMLKDRILALAERGGKIVIRPDCYSEDTYIYTPNGWKLFKDLKEDEYVAQVLDDGSYEFVKPLKYVKQYYVGEMEHIYDFHKTMDLLVTPNHRMIYKRKLKNGELSEIVKEAKTFNTKRNAGKIFYRSARAQNQNKKLTFLERLNIAFQADGSFATRCKNRIRFSFSKERKNERLRWILKNANLEYKEYKLKDGKIEFNISFDNAKEFFKKDFSWVSLNNLCSNWCNEFLEELKHWDSSIRSEGRFKYNTTTKECAEIVELIAVSAGKGVTCSISKDERKEHFKDTYTLHIRNENTLQGDVLKETINYDGYVYCVQVPTGRLLVKRNRSILVCGNSGDPTKIPLELTKLLMKNFGYSTNAKGYKALPPFLGVLQGDGINGNSIKDILHNLEEEKLSLSNLVFGMGGKLVMPTKGRDEFSFAMKATAQKLKGETEWQHLIKDPITDAGKKSLSGHVSVFKNEQGKLLVGEIERINLENDYWQDIMLPVFKNGEVIEENINNFDEIKQMANI